MDDLAEELAEQIVDACPFPLTESQETDWRAYLATVLVDLIAEDA